MRKAIFLASLSVMMASVLGMPADKVGEDGNTRLMAAIVNEDDNGIRSCYNSGDVNVSCQNKDGNNAIMLALIHDNLKLAKKMLNRLSNDGIQRLLISQKNKTPLSKEQTKQTRSWSHVNDTNEEGETLLHIAARKNAMELVKILIDLGADVNAANEDGSTPLEVAVRHDRFDIVDYLLGCGAVYVPELGFSLTHFVVEGHNNIVKYLIEHHKAYVNVEVDLHGDTSLFYACRFGHENLVKYLIEQGADVNHKNNSRETLLFPACRSGNEDLVKYLVETLKADVNHKNRSRETLLFPACRSGNEDLVKYLVEKHGADVNQENDREKTPLFSACESGHENLVKYLIEQGADVDKEDVDGETPLSIAISKNHESVVECLIKHRADVNRDDKRRETPLTKACDYGNEDLVKYLVETLKADVNKENKSGRTPLSCACSLGNESLMKYLVEHGANVNKTSNGRHLLFYAYEPRLHKNKENIAKYLIENVGADVNGEDKDGKTPLFYACSSGDESLVKYLVEHGADVNKESKEGETPLFIAIRKGYESIVKYLIERGADVNKTNNYGETPMDMARRYQEYGGIFLYLMEILAPEDNESSGDESDDMSISEYLQELGVGAVLKDGSELSEDDL